MKTKSSKILNKLSDEVLAVYHNLEGDHTEPFSYFIGCKVEEGTGVPDELNSLTFSCMRIPKSWLSDK